jgi:hypothetical protein
MLPPFLIAACDLKKGLLTYRVSRLHQWSFVEPKNVPGPIVS